MSSWRKLLERYADAEHPICNCSQAYYSRCDTGSKWDGEKWVDYTDGWACAFGCGANVFNVKDYIATKVLEELGEEI